MQLKPGAGLAALLILAACDKSAAPAPVVAPPPATIGYASSWVSSKTGLIFSASYFTAAQVDDPAWEAQRMSQLGMVRICATGQRVAHRDVRWFPATRKSRERCAAVVYTIACDIPTHAPADTLEQDRQDALLGEMPTEPEKGCGEKDWTRRLDQPGTDIQGYLDAQALLVDRSVCDLRTPRLDGRIAVGPKTRIGVATRIERTLATRMDERWQLPRLAFDFAHNPVWLVGGALHNAGRLGAIFPASHTVPADAANIRITQAIGLGRDGRPYCLQLTARQDDRVWRRTIERSGAEGYAGLGNLGMEERGLVNALIEAMGLPAAT